MSKICKNLYLQSLCYIQPPYVRFVQKEEKKLSMSDVNPSYKFQIFSILNIQILHFCFLSPWMLWALDLSSPDKQEEIKGNIIHPHGFCCLFTVLINDQEAATTRGSTSQGMSRFLPYLLELLPQTIKMSSIFLLN